MHYSGKSLFSYAFVANSARQREGHDVAGTSIFRGKISWALCVEWFHSPGVCSLVLQISTQVAARTWVGGRWREGSPPFLNIFLTYFGRGTLHARS